MKEVDRYNNDGVTVSLMKDKDTYYIQRKDGKYKHLEKIGKMTEEEAESRFQNMR